MLTTLAYCLVLTYFFVLSVLAGYLLCEVGLTLARVLAWRAARASGVSGRGRRKFGERR